MDWKKIKQQLVKDAEKSGIFDLYMFNPEHVMEKKLIDVFLLDTGDNWELQLIFEDGKEIQICMTGDEESGPEISIQTD